MGAGYTDITFTMEMLVLGAIGYESDGEPIVADGIIIAMSTEVLYGGGYSIPFKLADADHSNLDTYKEFFCTNQDKTLTVAVYIDPEVLEAAPPGDYVGDFYYISRWSPTGKYGGGDYIHLHLSKSASKPGDVNGNGEVNVTDVTALVNIILGSTTDYDMLNVDVNGDGEVNVTDVTALVNIILGQ